MRGPPESPRQASILPCLWPAQKISGYYEKTSTDCDNMTDITDERKLSNKIDNWTRIFLSSCNVITLIISENVNIIHMKMGISRGCFLIIIVIMKIIKLLIFWIWIHSLYCDVPCIVPVPTSFHLTWPAFQFVRKCAQYRSIVCCMLYG